MLRDIARADLIILDEFGYVPFDIDRARLLYQIIAGSYERRSIIFTTNIDSVNGDDLRRRQTRRSVIGRIVHHGRLLEFTGPSRRVSEGPHVRQEHLRATGKTNQMPATSCLNPKKIHD